MKTKHTLPALALALGLLSLSAFSAAPPSPASNEPTSVKTETATLPPLPAALAKLTPINDASINLKAKYYILLFSASWCGPCRMEAPQFITAYNETISKNPDISLIQLSADKNREDALNWIKNTGMKYPVLFGDGIKNLPGVQENAAPYIPFGLILNADGKLLFKGHGSEILEKYQEICK